METNVVMVKLWGIPVGYLSWDKKTNSAVFEYEPEFLNKGLDIAPLSRAVDKFRNHAGELGIGKQLIDSIESDFVRI